MPKYHITGLIIQRISFNVNKQVNADNESEAVEKILFCVADPCEWDLKVEVIK